MSRNLQIAIATIAIGVGIWGVHFIGMHALTMPISLEPWLAVASLLLSIGFSVVVFYLLLNRTITILHWLLCGVVWGLGISSMHYTGMAAIDTAMIAAYDPTIIGVSVLVSVIVSLLVLAVTVHGLSQKLMLSRIGTVVAASTFGLGGAAMHYINMLSISFVQPGLVAEGYFPTENYSAIMGSSHIALLLMVAAIVLLVPLFLSGRGQAQTTVLSAALEPFKVFNILALMCGTALVVLSFWIQEHSSEIDLNLTKVASNVAFTVSHSQNVYQEIRLGNAEYRLKVDVIEPLTNSITEVNRVHAVLITPFLELLLKQRRNRIMGSLDILQKDIHDYQQLLMIGGEQHSDANARMLADQVNRSYNVVQLQAENLLDQADIVGHDNVRIVQWLNLVFLIIVIVIYGGMTLIQRRQTILLGNRNDMLQETLRELRSQKIALDKHNIVSIADVNGNIIYTNEKFCEISEYSPDELIGENHRIINSGLHDSAFWRDMWHTIARGDIWHGVIRNRKKSGDIYWLDTTIVPFMNEHGEPNQYVSIRTDISQRIEAEEKIIKDNEDLERRVAQRTAELVERDKTIDQDARIMRLSLEGTTLLTGGDFYNAVLKNLCEVLQVKYAFISELVLSDKSMIKVLAGWADGHEAKSSDYALVGVPHSIADIQLSWYINASSNEQERMDPFLQDRSIRGTAGVLFHDNKGSVLCQLCVLHDNPIAMEEERLITVLRLVSSRIGAEILRMRAEQQLLESEKKFRSIFDFAQDGIMLIDVNSLNIVSANLQLSRMFGVATERLDGRHVLSLFPQGKTAEYRERIANTVSSGFSMEHNILLQRSDGTFVYTDINTSLIEISGKRHLLAILHDVTARRNNEEQLRQAYKYKSDFLSNMSHELRTPLNAIIGFSKAMLKGIDGPVTEEQEQSLGYIAKSGEHLKQLISDILDLSKLEAARMELKCVEFDIHTLVDDAVNSMMVLANEKNLQLSQQCSPDLPIINADKQRIYQVLLNIISNAVKFTHGGSIEVRCTMVTSDNENLPEKVRNVMNSNHDYLCVSVKDSGIGIAKEDQGKVFEEFRQIDSSSTRKHGGSGLGMTISKRLIELHGGQIWFDSVVGKGATFSFVIPAQQTEKSLQVESVDTSGVE